MILGYLMARMLKTTLLASGSSRTNKSTQASFQFHAKTLPSSRMKLQIMSFLATRLRVSFVLICEASQNISSKHSKVIFNRVNRSTLPLALVSSSKSIQEVKHVLAMMKSYKSSVCLLSMPRLPTRGTLRNRMPWLESYSPSSKFARSRSPQVWQIIRLGTCSLSL